MNAVAAPLTAIEVPLTGLEEATVFRVLGLTWREVYPLHNDVLLSPRDYRYQSRPRYATYYYTPTGVRTLIAHFGLNFEVRDPAPPTPTQRQMPLMWWQKDDA